MITLAWVVVVDAALLLLLANLWSRNNTHTFVGVRFLVFF
jgi:hypothetical protein